VIGLTSYERGDCVKELVNAQGLVSLSGELFCAVHNESTCLRGIACIRSCCFRKNGSRVVFIRWILSIHMCHLYWISIAILNAIFEFCIGWLLLDSFYCYIWVLYRVVVTRFFLYICVTWYWILFLSIVLYFWVILFSLLYELWFQQYWNWKWNERVTKHSAYSL